MDNKKEAVTMGKCCDWKEQRSKQYRSHTSTSRKDMRKEQAETRTRPKSEYASVSAEFTKDEGSNSFLEELALFEEQSKEREKKDLEQGFLEQEENRQRWRNLHSISMSQCLSRPWVSSYFRHIPLRIYCLPLGNTPQPKKKKKKR